MRADSLAKSYLMLCEMLSSTWEELGLLSITDPRWHRKCHLFVLSAGLTSELQAASFKEEQSQP